MGPAGGENDHSGRKLLLPDRRGRNRLETTDRNVAMELPDSRDSPQA